jgi:hypothetical protein
VRDVLDLSASDNLIVPSLPILFPVLCENEYEANSQLQQRLRSVRDVFDLSASDNLIIPLSPI